MTSRPSLLGEVPMLRLSLVIAFLLCPSSAHSSLVRCKGTALDAQGFTHTAEVTIALPADDAYDKSLWVLNRNNSPAASIHHVIAITTIDVAWSLATPAGAQSKPTLQRHPLTITRKPTASNSLVGFYMNDVLGGQPVTIKADLWNERRTFALVNTATGLGVLSVVGQCDTDGPHSVV